VLDWVFSYTDESEAVKELVIFITPLVVSNPDENDTNFNEADRRRLDQLSRPLDDMTRKLIIESRVVPTDGEEKADEPPLMDAPSEP
jgi:type II secretory pathway component GspD/PulD (secretin)